MGGLRQLHALLHVQILTDLDFIYKANTRIASVWSYFPYSNCPPPHQTNVEFRVPNRIEKKKRKTVEMGVFLLVGVSLKNSVIKYLILTKVI